MDSKTADFLSKILLEDDQDDEVKFAFPNEKRKIKCSISMLSTVSSVFEVMFSSRWSQEEPDGNTVDESVDQQKTIKLDDDVTFNQYLTFKLFTQILYGLRQINSLSVEQATSVYFYAHKYKVNDVLEKLQEFLSERMESGMSKEAFSLNEISDSIRFAEMYGLNVYKKQLDLVKLAFDDENPMKFYELAKKYEMNELKQQIINHLKTVPPKEDWIPEVYVSIIKILQNEIKKEIKSPSRASRLSMENRITNLLQRERTYSADDGLLFANKYAN